MLRNFPPLPLPWFPLPENLREQQFALRHLSSALRITTSSDEFSVLYSCHFQSEKKKKEKRGKKKEERKKKIQVVLKRLTIAYSSLHKANELEKLSTNEILRYSIVEGNRDGERNGTDQAYVGGNEHTLSSCHWYREEDEVLGEAKVDRCLSLRTRLTSFPRRDARYFYIDGNETRLLVHTFGPSEKRCERTQRPRERAGGRYVQGPGLPGERR